MNETEEEANQKKNETEKEAAKSFYEACLSGSVETLNELIREDKLILHKVNSTDYFFNYTPLHVAVLCGHLDFTKALLRGKPKLATELDLRRWSPLHLASAEGHLEIVRVLLLVNTDVCTIRDREGRTPLHLAVMKGRVEIIQKLLGAKPDSIHDKLGRRETVLHLSVKYDKLEVLKTLVEYLLSNDMESNLLNSTDDDGNTILHLAAAYKQVDTVEYLLGKKSVKDHANDKNQNGSTALDVMEHFPRDLKTIEIRESLLQAGVHKSVWRRPEPNVEYSPPHILPNNPPRTGVIFMGCIRWFWTRFKVDRDWLKEVRGYLIMAATLTATMAYQSILSPPGGIWQEAKGGQNAASPAPSPSLGNTADDKHIGGQAATASNADGSYGNYLVLNSIVLGASLSTIMLVMSGFPKENKFLTWLLLFTVYITLSCMGAAYVIAINLVSPAQLSDDALKALWIGWTCICAFVMVLHSSRFLVWLGNKLVKLVQRCYRCCKPTPRATRNVRMGNFC